MTENQTDLAFALKMYGEAMVTYAKDNCTAHYRNLYFWHDQAFMCAKNVAKEI